MNEVLNNPMVIDILNKTGMTLEAGLAECVRYTMFWGLLSAIIGGVFLLVSLCAVCLCLWRGYKHKYDDDIPYALLATIPLLLGVISARVMLDGLSNYLYPAGYLLKEVILK